MAPQRLAVDLRSRGQTEPAQIVEATALIAADPQLREYVDRAVAVGRPLAAAVTAAAEHFAPILAGLDDPVPAARAADVRAAGRRLAAALGAGWPERRERGADRDRL